MSKPRIDNFQNEITKLQTKKFILKNAIKNLALKTQTYKNKPQMNYTNEGKTCKKLYFPYLYDNWADEDKNHHFNFTS